MLDRLTRLVRPLAAMMFVTGCAFGGAGAQGATQSAPSSAERTAAKSATIVQINDIYRIDGLRNGTVGGPGRIVSVIERTKRETRGPVMAFLAGDFVAPSLESRVFDGRPMVDALNAVHERAPLLVTAGNHEFDDRTNALFAAAVARSHFGWIISNARIDVADSVTRRLSRDTVLTLGALRVGVFALTLIESPRAWVALDTAYVRVAEREIERLEQQNVDAIVGLTHLDMPVDMEIAKLKSRHPKFVWIAGGHEHYLQVQPATESSALITKGDANARRIWRVTVSADASGARAQGDSIVLDVNVPIDATYKTAVIDHYRDELHRTIPFFDTQVGRANVRMDATEQTVRADESNWGNLLTDVMRTAFPDVPADVAVLNGGTLRIDDEIEGVIRWEHLARSFGFPARVGLVWLRGRDLRLSLLEQGVSADRPEGRFLQVSGLRFTYDPSRRVNDRVTSVEIRRGDRYEPLDDSRIYVVAVPEFMYYGGDGFHFKDRAIQVLPPGPELRLMTFDWIANAFARGEGVGGAVEGRINRVGR